MNDDDGIDCVDGVGMNMMMTVRTKMLVITVMLVIMIIINIIIVLMMMIFRGCEGGGVRGDNNNYQDTRCWFELTLIMMDMKMVMMIRDNEVLIMKW